jgi:acyl-CoA synthetase (AMP-forming)/AMP-acid ligase II
VNLAAYLAYHALGRPRHPAIIDPQRTIAHGELDVMVRRAAAWLRAQGISPGTLVGLRLADSAEHLIQLLALARLGAVALPLDWRWTRAEVERVAQRFAPKLVLGEPDADLLSDTLQVAPGTRWLASQPDPSAPYGGADTPLLVSLSSGTTGAPRGPTVTHGEMLARFMTQFVTLGFNGDDRYLCVTPLYFGAGRSFCLSHLVAGASVCLLAPPVEPAALMDAVARWRPSVLFLVPTLLRRLLPLARETAPEATPLLAGVRVLVSSGAALHADERDQVLRRLTPNLYDYYASTEGGGISVLAPADQRDHAGTVGRPAFAVAVEVVDADDRPAPAGTVGRLRYRGPGVAADGGDGARRPGGWFYPGDLAAIDADGFVTLKGRAADVIIRGGINIYPAEIEQVLLAHPGVREAAVVGQPSRERGEEVAAFVVAGTTVTESALRRHCQDRLAPYKHPRTFRFARELPKSGLGKILKDRLAATLEPLP